MGKTGFVFSLTGEVAPNAIVVHQVPYGTQGSQNDGLFTWTDHQLSNGPKPQLFATRIECVDLPTLPTSTQTGPCLLLDATGWLEGTIKDMSYSIANGNGNPDVLGPTAQYKIWIVGDRERAVQYTVSANWNSPGCT